MSSILEQAIAAALPEVLDPAAVAAKIEAELRVLNYHVAYDYVAVGLKEHTKRRLAKKAAAKDAAASAIDYRGKIERCQATSGEEWQHRCENRPTKVRQTVETRGDGRLAVCGIHARKPRLTRWMKDSPISGLIATEPVEPEYQFA